MRNTLISQLVGIARACNSNPKADSTDNFIIECVRALSSDDTEKITELAGRAETEKTAVAPNCANCVAKCGGTDDYDMSIFENAPEDIRNAKSEILSEIYKIKNFDSNTLECIYYGFFAFGESWTVQQINSVAEEIRKCRLK